MLSYFVEPVSTFASQVDALFLLILVLGGFWFVFAEAMFLGLIFKFRYREGQKAQYLDGHEKRIKRWVTIPHALIIVCDVIIIVGAINVWYHVKQALPPADATVRVIGQQWVWTFVHPGADGKLDTDDDIAIADELHVQKDLVYHFQLESRDVLHSFSVPVFRLKQDAVPGRVITGWFEATKPGTYDIQCAEMCGMGHGLMAARLVVETPEEHAAWVAKASVN